MRAGEYLFHRCLLGSAEAEGLELQRHNVALQKAYHDALAEHRGNRRNPQIVFHAPDPLPEATVLCQSAFGNVQVGHHLDPGIPLPQHAVDAVADLELTLKGLDVDIGGPDLRRLLDEATHQPDDRGLARQFLQLLDVVNESGGIDPVFLAGLLSVVAELLEGRLDVGGNADTGFDGFPAAQTQRLDHVTIEGIRHHHGQRLFGLVQDQGPARLQESARHPLLNRHLHREIGFLDQPDTELHCQGLRDVPFRHQAEFNQQGADPLPRMLALLQAEGTLDVVVSQLAGVHQHGAQGFPGRRSDRSEPRESGCYSRIACHTGTGSPTYPHSSD